MKDPKDNETQELVGLAPRGEAMPISIEEWVNLAHLYEKRMLKDKEQIGRLKAEINGYKQKLACIKRYV